MGIEVTKPVDEPDFDNYCHSIAQEPANNNDYLLIPPNNMHSLYPQAFPILFCGTSLNGANVMTEGPFVLTFNSDEFLSTDETGFELTYSTF